MRRIIAWWQKSGIDDRVAGAIYVGMLSDGGKVYSNKRVKSSSDSRFVFYGGAYVTPDEIISGEEGHGRIIVRYTAGRSVSRRRTKW